MIRKILIFYFLVLQFSCKQHYAIKDINALELSANESYTDKDYSKCVELYTSLIDLDSTKDLFFFRRGMSNYHLKQYELSINDFSKCINMNAGSAKVYFNLGFAYEHLNEFDSSIYCLNKSYELDSTRPNLKEIIRGVKIIANLKRKD